MINDNFYVFDCRRGTVLVGSRCGKMELNSFQLVALDYYCRNKCNFKHLGNNLYITADQDGMLTLKQFEFCMEKHDLYPTEMELLVAKDQLVMVFSFFRPFFRIKEPCSLTHLNGNFEEYHHCTVCSPDSLVKELLGLPYL